MAALLAVLAFGSCPASATTHGESVATRSTAITPAAVDPGLKPEDPFDVAVRRAQAYATDRLALTTSRIPPTAWPLQTSGSLWTTTGPTNWGSGFFPGRLWYGYQGTASGTLLSQAQAWQAGLAGQAANTTSHDVGFIVFDSFGNGYRLTGNDAYRQTVLKAAASLSTRYNAKVGAVRSWNSGPTEHKVIIDNMMNLELLLWASKHGGKRSWYDQAVSHALKTATNHVRPDGSSCHLVTYDPATGAVKSRTTVQGAADTSTWARGQAWAIHGFTMVYRETSDVRFLATARRAADWYLDHLPADQVPYWDFDSPGIPDAPRDTSAAAIAASGLLELTRLDPDPARKARYLTRAKAIVVALISPPWISEGTGSEAVLLHGTYSAPAGNVDTGLTWGDYYLQEALMRLRQIAPIRAPLPVAAVTASSSDTNLPKNAIDGSLSTRWSARGDGQWLRLDLGRQSTISKVTVAVFEGSMRASRFDVQTSVDGQRWTTQTRAVTSGTTNSAETYDTVARYVQLVGHGASGTTWSSVTEFRAIS
jgi:unsaturated chondroitin disaccharide hydrolase